MAEHDTPIVDPHTKIILDRYADQKNLNLPNIAPDIMVERYLSKVMDKRELEGKTILEIGAGCSPYIRVFMDYGCKSYYANDIISERLVASRVDDPRYHELPGDFRKIELPEQVDIVFANLTMMFIQPMLGDFVARIGSALKHGGIFLSFDPNYICPLSIYRRFKDKDANPAMLFSPLGYAKTFEKNGFEVEKLVPFTARQPWTTGNWLLGTSFWLKARKL